MPQQRTVESVKPQWKPVKPAPKKTVVLHTYEVHIAGKNGSEQIIENVRDESAAVAQYVKNKKLVSYHYTFRTVEMQAA